MTIELQINNLESIMLAPVKVVDAQSDSAFYDLVDQSGKRWMQVKLEGTSFIPVWKEDELTEPEEDLIVKLQKLVLEVIEAEQSGTEFSGGLDADEMSPYDPEKIKIHSKAFNLRLISDMIKDGDIDLSPDFQRKFVWDSFQKSRLIESILLRIPLPMFYFAEDEEGRITVVDGLQRLTTIKEFMDNKFPLKGLEYLKNSCEGRYYSGVDANGNPNGLTGIDAKYFRWFNQTQFSVNVIDPTSPAKVKYDIFRRINTGGKPLNNQEIRNCLSSTNLRALLNEMTTLHEFRTATDYSVRPTRMEDHEIALRFILFSKLYNEDQTLSNYSGNIEASLDSLTEDLSRISPEERAFWTGKFSNAMRNAEYLIGNRYAFRKIRTRDLEPNASKQLLNKALFVSLSVLLSEFNPDEVQQTCEELALQHPIAEAINNNYHLYNYLSYSTNSRVNLTYTFNAMNELIKQHVSNL